MSNPNEQSDLEKMLGKIGHYDELLEVYRGVEHFPIWHKRLEYVDKALPEAHLGQRLLVNLKANAKELTQEEASRLIELARIRLDLHTTNGAYRPEHVGADDHIDQLPGSLVEIKKGSIGSPEEVNMYLEYCQKKCIHFPVLEFRTGYERFIAVKRFYEGVPPEYHDLPILRDEVCDGSWDELKLTVEPKKSPEDAESIRWMDEFRRIETRYKINFKDVIDFMTKTGRVKAEGDHS